VFGYERREAASTLFELLVQRIAQPSVDCFAPPIDPLTPPPLMCVHIQKNEQPISTTMMNVLTRALARSSDTTTVGKVFNAYEPTYGLQPDIDTYNAVLESCESHAKVGAVNGMLALMSSRGVAPNTISWNLLLSTTVKAGEQVRNGSRAVLWGGAGTDAQ
jgi:pentatricopeptide repeat protein